MTTTVVVKANHGWPVDVTPLDPKTGAMDTLRKVRVGPGMEQMFCVHSSQDLRIHEVQPDEAEQAPPRTVSPVMKYFAYEHLPAKLQEVSKPIGDLARQMDETLSDGPEKSAGLRKLLEAKDCLVRAKLG